MKKITFKLLTLFISLLIISTTIVYATVHDAGFTGMSSISKYVPAIASRVNNHLKTGVNQTVKMIDVNIIAGEKNFSAKFYNNNSAEAIVSQMPFTLDMSDFSNQEKVAPLTFELPNASTEIPATIRSGELYLWSGNQMVLFYTSFSSNSYSYVPIGYIDDVAGLTEALGSGDSTISFTVN